MSGDKALPMTHRQIATRVIDLLILGEAPEHIQQQAIDYLLGLATRLDQLSAAADQLGITAEESKQ